VRFPVVDDLTEIAADDRLLDYLAAGRSDYVDLFAGTSALLPSRLTAVAPMLATWRAEFVDPPLPELPKLHALPASKRLLGRTGGLPPRRSVRPLLGVAAAIGALLLGSAAVGAHSSQPGDTLWPLTQVLYSSHAQSLQAKLQVKKSIEVARHFLDSSEATKAIPPLRSANVEIKRVEPSDGADGLQSDLKKLWVEVNRSRDKSAAVQKEQASTEAARIAAQSVAKVAGKSGNSAAKHSAAPGSAAKGQTKAPGSTPAAATNGAPVIPGAGEIATTVPGAPDVAPAPVTSSDATTAGAGPVVPVTTQPVVPVPVTTQSAPVAPTTVDPVGPTETTDPTVVDPTTSTEARTTDQSTTSEIPTAPATTTDTGTAEQGQGDPSSTVPSDPSQ
jgi:hypothetical protein